MRLVAIPADKYDDYSLDVIFRAYKWDPQFSDSRTIAKHILIISEAEHAELVNLTEKLHKETALAEQVLNSRQKLSKALALPWKIRRHLPRMIDYQADMHVRLMRFDFHPVAGKKWAISEVNSDVPGGFAEAAIMPKIAAALLDNKNYRHIDYGEILAKSISKKVRPGGSIMLVHCTSYSDDRQVMQYLGDKLECAGFRVIYAAADHLRFEDKKAISVLEGYKGEVNAIFRFTPIEWLVSMKPKRWQGFFNTTTPSCNHPVAVYAQTKNFPFVWHRLEELGVSLSTWRQLLPETLKVKDAGNTPGYIYKPAFGRVGEGISIKEACRDDEYEKILKDVKKHPRKYIAQKKFESKPLASDDGENYHVCIGSYSIDGSAAGYYGRLSKTPRIDSAAADIPVFVECPGCESGFQTQAPCQEQDIRRREIYDSWAPKDMLWARWVHPVLFAQIDDLKSMKSVADFSIPDIFYLSEFEKNTAVFIDLPSYTGVTEALALAQLGWLPIPLYNSTTAQRGAMALVDDHDIKCALMWGADELKKIDIPSDAPPVFLLDSNRMNRHKMNVTVFDNSWDLYAQDVPSAECFLDNSITRIIIRSQVIRKDLAGILYKYRKKGITILYTDGYEKAKEIVVRKPPRRFR